MYGSSAHLAEVYSPECVEVEFRELLLYRILRSCAPGFGKWHHALRCKGTKSPLLLSGRKESTMHKMRRARGMHRARGTAHTPFGAQVAFKRATGGAMALGALAVGATAIGALAIGALAIRALVVKRGRIERLNIEELEVGRLHVRELVVEQEQRAGTT
jgi:hypothetical protein